MNEFNLKKLAVKHFWLLVTLATLLIGNFSPTSAWGIAPVNKGVETQLPTAIAQQPYVDRSTYDQWKVYIDPKVITFQYLFRPNFRDGIDFWKTEGVKASVICKQAGVVREDLSNVTIMADRKFDQKWKYLRL